MTLIIFSLNRSEVGVSFCLLQSLFFSYYDVDEYSIFSIYVVAQSFFDWSIYDHIIHTYIGHEKRCISKSVGERVCWHPETSVNIYTSFIDYYYYYYYYYHIIGFGFLFFLTLFTIMILVIVLCFGGVFFIFLDRFPISIISLRFFFISVRRFSERLYQTTRMMTYNMK